MAVERSRVQCKVRLNREFIDLIVCAKFNSKASDDWFERMLREEIDRAKFQMCFTNISCKFFNRSDNRYIYSFLSPFLHSCFITFFYFLGVPVSKINLLVVLLNNHVLNSFFHLQFADTNWVHDEQPQELSISRGMSYSIKQFIAGNKLKYH